MKLLIVIPCCKNDAARAEHLIDLVYQLEGRKAKGHCLLVCAPDVHSEMRAKLKISASLAFETVELFDNLQIITLTKHEQTMEMLLQTARHIHANYIWPWLWLEPDCLPLVSGWLEKLATAYENQPRRFMGLHLNASGVTYFSRTSIYPSNATHELEEAAATGIPYDQTVAKKSVNCRLFQFMSVTSVEDKAKVREDALLLHHDKNGVLLDWVRGKASPEPEIITGLVAIAPQAAPSELPKRRGRPPIVKPPEPVLV